MKRALLIGSQTGGLAGADADVGRMSTALSQQGFAVTAHTGAQATRDGILAAYERLIADSCPGDAVCVYYSGHGNLVRNPGYEAGKAVPRELQYLVPTDDGDGVFRGVMSFELSRLLARLTRKTSNVTVILDCCHSAQMSRAAIDRKLTPKASSVRVTEDQVCQLLKLSAAAAEFVDVESSPYAVRLVAAEAHSIAFERVNEQGEATGAFTEALLCAFSELQDEPVSWAAIMLRVRELVMHRIPGQRPDAEGPRQRRLWSLEQALDEHPIPVFFVGEEARIRGGALLGVVPGATYGVMPPHSDAYREESCVAKAIVEQSFGSTSRVRLEPRKSADLTQTGLLAFPLSVPPRKCEVVLAGDVPAELRARIAASRTLTPARVGGDALLPSVTRHGEAIVLRDPLGELLLQRPVAEVAEVVERLERVARAEDLRHFEPGQLDAALGVTFGRVENGALVPMQDGEALHVGDRQYLCVKNEGFENVFVAVLGIDAIYDIHLMLLGSPRGRRLTPNDPPLIWGQRNDGAILGVVASWPTLLPTDAPRRESLIVIAADDEQDFMLLTTADVASKARGGFSVLERHLWQIRGGEERVRGARSTTGSEYWLRRVDYQLHPEPRSAPT